MRGAGFSAHSRPEKVARRQSHRTVLLYFFFAAVFFFGATLPFG